MSITVQTGIAYLINIIRVIMQHAMEGSKIAMKKNGLLPWQRILRLEEITATGIRNDT